MRLPIARDGGPHLMDKWSEPMRSILVDSFRLPAAIWEGFGCDVESGFSDLNEGGQLLSQWVS